MYRFTSEQITMPGTESPCLYIVADGSMRLYTPSGMMDYMAGHILIIQKQNINILVVYCSHTESMKKTEG